MEPHPVRVQAERCGVTNVQRCISVTETPHTLAHLARNRLGERARGKGQEGRETRPRLTRLTGMTHKAEVRKACHKDRPKRVILRLTISYLNKIKPTDNHI